MLALSFSACDRPAEPASGRLVSEWMQLQYGVLRGERLPPPVAARLSAYAAIALYEGIASGSPRLRSLAGQLTGLQSLPRPNPEERLDWPTVAIVAQRTTLRALLIEGFASTQNAIDELSERQLAARSDAGISAEVRDRATRYGEVLGRAIVAWAAQDGFVETRDRRYDPPKGRNLWVNTTTVAEYTSQSVSPVTEFVALRNPTAAFQGGEIGERQLLMNRPKLSQTKSLASVNPNRALEPYWGQLRPFVLRSADECPVGPPAPYSEDPSSAFYREVRAVYDASRALTEDQRNTAFFWADNPGQTGTPPGHWINIVSQLVDQFALDAPAAAEAYAVTAIAMADAFIGCWQEKYRVNVVRPVTMIQRLFDPEWRSVVVTPPFPEYPSGHSVQSAAASEVLTSLFGERPFIDSTHVNLGHPPRRFASFRQAAREAAISRLYGGIHYPMGIDNGIRQGQCIGQHVIQRLRTRNTP